MCVCMCVCAVNVERYKRIKHNRMNEERKRQRPRIVDWLCWYLGLDSVVWLADGDVQRSQFARLLIPGDVGGVAFVRQQVEGWLGAPDVSRHRTRHQDIPRRSERRRKSSRSQRSHRVNIIVVIIMPCVKRLHRADSSWCCSESDVMGKANGIVVGRVSTKQSDPSLGIQIASCESSSLDRATSWQVAVVVGNLPGWNNVTEVGSQSNSAGSRLWLADAITNNQQQSAECPKRWLWAPLECWASGWFSFGICLLSHNDSVHKTELSAKLTLNRWLSPLTRFSRATVLQSLLPPAAADWIARPVTVIYSSFHCWYRYDSLPAKEERCSISIQDWLFFFSHQWFITDCWSE